MTDFIDLHGATNKLIRAVADAAMQRHGLRLGQNLLLAALWKEDGLTPGAVAKALNVTTPTVVKMATRMTASGLLARRQDKRDYRLVRLHLTAAGRRLQKPIEAERRSMEKQLTASLTKAERECLLRALTKINGAAADLLRSVARPG